MKQDFVFDREKKKAQQSDGQGEERNLQKADPKILFAKRSNI